jgi:hypothetical protein
LGKSTLDAFGLEYFHMKEYVRSVDAFEGWSDEKRRALATNLFPIIPGVTTCGVAVAMVNREFDEGLKDYPDARAALGHPYQCCFHWFISLAFNELPDLKKARFEIIHENNDFKKDALRSSPSKAKKLSLLCFNTVSSSVRDALSVSRRGWPRRLRPRKRQWFGSRKPR